MDFWSRLPSMNMLLWVVFGVVVVIYAVVSLIFVYHWRRYSLHNKRVVFFETMYFVVSLGVLFVAFMSLLLI